MAGFREFLYVDVDRTRSLLAQLQGGVVEAIKSQRVHTAEGGVSARLLGFGAHGDYGYEAGTEESRSLQDLTFVVFEELAEEEDLITDLGEDVREPKSWEEGRVHAQLRPGQVIRLTCDLQILDGGLFRERLKRFETMADAMLKISPPATSASMSRAQRQAAMNAARDEVMGGMTSSQLDGISGFVEAFVGDSVALRVLPCGIRNLEYGFSGALLGRKEYLQEEREHLFSRYGARPSDWTAVMQVAAIPRPEERQEEVQIGSSSDGADISRAEIEQMASGLLTEMERLGVMEGPRWPSVSVTILGIYRSLPED